VVLPLRSLELRNRTKHAFCGRVRSRNICFGHVPVAVRQGQRCDAEAIGEERHGRCAAGMITHIRLYRYSGKLALAPMHLRRARVVGRSFAAGAQPLARACAVGACGKNNSAWASGGPAGAGVWRHALGDGAHCPSGRQRAKYRSLNHHLGFKSFGKFSNFRGLGCSRKGVAHHQAATKSQNFAFSPAADSAGSPL
jgi:hypothetical protein